MLDKEQIIKELYDEFNVQDSVDFDILLGEKLFLILKENNWNYDLLINGEYSKYFIFGLPSHYINKYLIEKLKLSGEDLLFASDKANQLENKFKEKRRKYEFDFYDKLVKTSSDEEVISLFSTYSSSVYFDMSRINNNVLEYVISKNLSLSKRNELHSSIKDKILVYSKYKRQINLLERKQTKENEEKLLVSQAKKIVLEYMRGNYDNRTAFCTEKNIDLSFFNKLLLILQKYDKKFYEKYSLFVESKRKKQFEYIMQNINNIVIEIASGVKENDSVRSYDFLDYCLATSLSLDEFEQLCKDSSLSGYKLRKVRAFVAKNLYVGSRKTKTVLDEKLIIKGREITKKEKELILKYLKDNHVAFNEKVYMIALRRYLNGTLLIEQKKKTRM